MVLCFNDDDDPAIILNKKNVLTFPSSCEILPTLLYSVSKLALGAIDHTHSLRQVAESFVSNAFVILN